MVQAAARRPADPAVGSPRSPRSTTSTTSMMKLEAAGNDFLVVLTDPSALGSSSLTPAQVRAICDRRRGVGADGLVLGRRGGQGVDLEMVLYNADGSEAEMSGNGIRCLVHAAVIAGIAPARDVCVATAAGRRTVAYEPARHGVAWARVGMGSVSLGEEVPSPIPRTRARLADVGNPHVVVIGDVDLDVVDLGSLGASAARVAGHPVNVEVVRPGRGGADLELRVLERGVGETLACGTGSCAAAAVARAWGLAGDVVTVDNPGGQLEVRLGETDVQVPCAGGPDGTADVGGTTDAASPSSARTTVADVELGGPVRKVADVQVDAALFDTSGHEDG